MFNLKPFAFPKDLRAAGVLSMNYRNHAVIAPNNPRRLYPLVDDKILTKKLARRIKINTPKMIGIISYQHQAKNLMRIVRNYGEFVLKPSRGSGGKGVLVIRHYTENAFTTAAGRTLAFNEVYQHISNILSGLYSLGGQNDVVLIEEVVHFSDSFKNYSYQGVPDVRVIVYKGYPALSMVRLATKESGGRANLHQGAVGVGIDIRTGKAMAAVSHDAPVSHHPDTAADLLKLTVPLWREHLTIAAKGFEMTGLGYIGADIVLDKERGPMMLELNARPGLAIQIANSKGLRSVLKTIDKSYPSGLSPDERIDFILKR